MVTVLQPILNRQAEKHQVTFIYSERDETPVVLGLSDKVSRIFMKMPEKPGPALFTAARELSDKIRFLGPDVVHLHSSMAGAIGRLAVLLAGFPRSRVVYTPHGYSFLRKDQPALKRLIFKAVETVLSRLGGVVAACSTGEYALASGLGARAALAPNGIEPDEVAACEKPRKPGPVTVAALGRVTPARAPEDFVRIAETVKAAMPDVRFIWIGWGDGGSDKVEWLGGMTREEALSTLSEEADIVLHPSLWEGLPMALLEAMALGKPVVAREIIGCKDAVVHGETGYLGVGVSDMAGYVLALAEDEALRRRFGENGRRRANLFTSERQSENLLALYDSLVNYAGK